MRPFPNIGGERGFTLLEVVVAILLVGLAVPSIIVPFSGIKDIKQPEYVGRATFLGMYQMEGIANESYGRFPAAGTYACASFLPTVGSAFKIDCNLDSEYSFSWTVADVSAATPDTAASGTFGKKITLSVTRVDGKMGTVKFHALF